MSALDMQSTEISSLLREIKNQNIKLPKNSDLLPKLQLEIANVVRFSLKEWQSAYEDAIEYIRYDREDLLDLYEQIEIDEHVTALVDTIYNSIMATPFSLVNENGEEDTEAMRIFYKPWLSQYVAACVGAIMNGFNAVQFTGVEDGTYSGIKLIPREHVMPFQNGVRYNDNSFTPDILFNDRSIKNWTAFMFPYMPADQYQLGKYNKIAKLFILKRENTQFWAIFNEIFGIPFRVLKTDIKDKTRMQNAINAMETMTAAAYSVIHYDDEIVFHNGVAAANSSTFKEFMNYCNKGMSKALVGSTMVLEDGSSLSQSQVHERNTMSFISSYKHTIAQWINSIVIPKMQALGMRVSSGTRFIWDDSKHVNKSELIGHISQLNAAGYRVPVEYVIEKTKIPVEEAQEIVSVKNPQPQNMSIYQRLQNIYKKHKKK